MFRLSMLLLLALVMTATGCETGSTHENATDSGVGGQNTGESSTKAGPVPGSPTGTKATTDADAQPAATTPAPAPQQH